MGQNLSRLILLMGFAAVLTVVATAKDPAWPPGRPYLLLGGGLAIAVGLLCQLAFRLHAQWQADIPIWDIPEPIVADPSGSSVSSSASSESSSASSSETTPAEEEEDSFDRPVAATAPEPVDATTLDLVALMVAVVLLFSLLVTSAIAYWCPPLLPLQCSSWFGVQHPYALAVGLSMLGMLAGFPLAIPVALAGRWGRRPRWTALGALLPVFLTLLVWLLTVSTSALVAAYLADQNKWVLDLYNFQLEGKRPQAFAAYYGVLAAVVSGPVYIMILSAYFIRTRVVVDREVNQD